MAPPAMSMGPGRASMSTHRPAIVSSSGNESPPSQYHSSYPCPVAGVYISVLSGPNRACHSAWGLISTQIVRDSAVLT